VHVLDAILSISKKFGVMINTGSAKTITSDTAIVPIARDAVPYFANKFQIPKEERVAKKRPAPT